jgi:hypothetical protein
MSDFIVVGLDLGQTTDPSALCVVEGTLADPDAYPPVYRYDVRSMFRWPLQTDYTRIAADVARFFAREPLSGCTLVVDQTGLGRPVVDLLRRQGVECGRLVPVTITSGQGVSNAEGGGYHVAKAVLVSTLQVLLQGKRLRFAEGLRETRTLLKELADYRMRISAALNELYSAREGAHDDLVLSLALACWFGEREPPPVCTGVPIFLGPVVPWAGLNWWQR